MSCQLCNISGHLPVMSDLVVMKAWRRAMDAVASASLDALLEDFAGSDPGLTAIVERFQVPFNPPSCTCGFRRPNSIRIAPRISILCT